jgi:hypothetical protein
MDPEEFEAYLATLTPEQQEQALSELGFAQANQVPYSFGGGGPGTFSPSLPRSSFDLGMMNQLPPDIEYGEVQPFGLDEFAQAQNAMQDVGALTLDPAIAMYAGRGAFDPSAFQPRTIPIGSPLDLAGSRYVGMMAQSGPGYESYLAQKIAGGMTPGQAVATMWDRVNTPDEALDPEGLEQKQALIASLPPLTSTDPATGMPSFQQGAGDFSTPEGRAASADVGAVTTVANDLFERMATDPVPGYTDPVSGLAYAGAYQQPSELAEKFQAYGIPLPTETYGDEEWLPPVNPQVTEKRMAREGAAQEALDQAAAARDFTTQNYKALQQGWRESAPTRQAAAAGPKPTGPAENPYNLAPGSLQAAQTAADIDWDVLSESQKGAPRFQDFRARARTAAGLPEVLNVGKGTTPREHGLLAKTAETAKTAYDQAYTAWEDEQKKRLQDEAMRRGAIANQGTGNPFVVSSGGKVLDTYNFGGTAAEQTGLGQLMSLAAQLQGNKNVQVGALPSNWQQSWGRGVEDVNRDWRQANFDLSAAQNRTAPDELRRAQALGTAYAMEQAGRTPMDDILMQRAMARTSMYPYTAGYGP